MIVQKRSTDILLVIALTSSDPRYDTLFLSNYATINLLDELKRMPGVADVTIFGARDYSMRVWLNPTRMARWASRRRDVAQAIARAERAVRAPARSAPSRRRPARPSSTRSPRAAAWSSPKSSATSCCARTGPNGVLRIRDVARIELGAQSYDAFTNRRRQARDRHGGLPAVGRQRARRSPMRSRAALRELSTDFPQGVIADHSVRHDALRRRPRSRK